MMMTYEKRPERYRAIQFDPEDFESALKFAGGSVVLRPGGLFYQALNGDLAYPGHWIVQDPQQGVVVLDEMEFEERFRPAVPDMVLTREV